MNKNFFIIEFSGEMMDGENQKPTHSQLFRISDCLNIPIKVLQEVIPNKQDASDLVGMIGQYPNESTNAKVKSIIEQRINTRSYSISKKDERMYQNFGPDSEKDKKLDFVEKLEKIPHYVKKIVYDPDNKNTIEQLNIDYDGDESEKQFKDLKVWNSKKQINELIIKLLDFSEDEVKLQYYWDEGKNKTTKIEKKIQDEIRILRELKVITDWKKDVGEVLRLTYSDLISNNEPSYVTNNEINIESDSMSDEYKNLIKRQKLPKTVLLALINTGKTIDEIQSVSRKFPGTAEQEIHRDKAIWHSKPEIDQYVREQLNISDDEWNVGDSNRPSFWYNHVAVEISKLREDGAITDWNPELRSGIFRLTNLRGIKGESTMETQNNIIKDDELLSKLPILSESDINKGYEEISKELLIKKETISEILNALMSKRHVLLTGPIGTGKTHLAKRIPEIFWKKYGGYKAEEYTATSDWSVQDVIGGVFPTMNGENIAYSFLNGCILETLEKDWEIKQRRRIENVDTPRGVWATIDEFNRADIDKAFGQLFTALRTGEIKYFKNNQDKTYERKIIPNDFRIIGTMNTSDKTFLYNLSDALKSRFAFIEIDVPEYQQKDEEMGMALSNALKELDIEAKELGIELFKNESLIDSKLSNENIIRILQYATEVLFIVRCFKKLGTSILKTIFQSLLISLNTMESKENEQGKLFEYHSESLDTAIISTIVPQLENLESKSDLNVLKAILDNELISFIRKSQKDIERENNLKSIKKILKFIKLDSEIEQKFVSDYESGNSIEDSLSKIQQEWSEKNILKAFKLKQTSKALSNLEESMIL